MDFPASEPSHYDISVGADCQTSYLSEGKLNPESEPGTFHYDFALSPANCTRVFELTKRAKYFVGELDSKKKNIASTGKKTLAYDSGDKTTQSSYNYSPHPEVQELTSLFQSLSATLEIGHRLEYFFQYQKLALEQELSRAEERFKQNDLLEIGALAPILQQIAADPTVVNATRARAQRLLAGHPPNSF